MGTALCSRAQRCTAGLSRGVARVVVLGESGLQLPQRGPHSSKPFLLPQRFSGVQPCSPRFSLGLAQAHTQNYTHEVTVTRTQNCSEIFTFDLQILDLPMTFHTNPSPQKSLLPVPLIV